MQFIICSRLRNLYIVCAINNTSSLMSTANISTRCFYILERYINMAAPTEILKKLLKQIATELNFVDYNLKVVPISSGGANYSSTLYEVTLTEGGKDIHMFAKVAALGEKMRTQAPNGFRMYKTEKFVYTNLTKIYSNLENEHQVPEEHRLIFCKFYGCNTKPYEETIVLENLVKSGYEAFDRFKCMSKEYAFSAVRELAKLHALSFAFSEYYSEKFSTTAEELKFQWNIESETVGNYFENSVAQAIMTTCDKYRESLQNFFKVMTKEAILDYATLTKRPVLGHGDFRPSNLMHRNRLDGTVDIRIVDLQTIQCSSPILDLLFFIFTGSDEQFRAQYYEQLIDHYYTQLHAAMKRLHLDPEKVFSRDDFENELKEKLPLGLIMAVLTLQIVTVEEEAAPKVDDKLVLEDLSTQKTNELYKERLNGIVNDYVKWGILQ